MLGARWGFAVVFVLITLGTLAYTLDSYFALDKRLGIDDIPYNELTKAALDEKKGISENLFEIGFLLLAALWGLLLAKKDEAGIVLSRNPEFVAFICASFLLLLSLVSHLLYLNEVMNGLSDSAKVFSGTTPTIINIFDKKFDYFFGMQIFNLVAGSLVAVATLISAHKFRD